MLIPLLLSCSVPKPDTGKAPGPAEDLPEDTHDYASYTGTARWTWGWSTTSGETLCDLVWNTTTEGTTPCADCTWSFRVDFTYDAAASRDEADCLSTLEEPDFNWKVGLMEDYGDYGVTIVAVYDTDYHWWAPTFTAAWTPPDILWAGGYNDDRYTYSDTTYYYTNYWYGVATVE